MKHGIQQEDLFILVVIVSVSGCLLDKQCFYWIRNSVHRTGLWSQIHRWKLENIRFPHKHFVKSEALITITLILCGTTDKMSLGCEPWGFRDFWFIWSIVGVFVHLLGSWCSWEHNLISFLITAQSRTVTKKWGFIEPCEVFRVFYYAKLRKNRLCSHCDSFWFKWSGLEIILPLLSQ